MRERSIRAPTSQAEVQVVSIMFDMYPNQAQNTVESVSSILGIYNLKYYLRYL